jgi:hypothetical protein
LGVIPWLFSIWLIESIRWTPQAGKVPVGTRHAMHPMTRWIRIGRATLQDRPLAIGQH